ncbi:MAG: chitobiase/beta-hexosaminidase C-terminal domain-containing protein [Verrucomicrobiales bacterium]
MIAPTEPPHRHRRHRPRHRQRRSSPIKRAPRMSNSSRLPKSGSAGCKTRSSCPPTRATSRWPNEIAAAPAPEDDLGHTLTFDAANTGMAQTFVLRNLNVPSGDPRGLVFDEPEGGIASMNFISIGDVNGVSGFPTAPYENDDFEIEFTSGSVTAFGFIIASNDGSAAGETLEVRANGSVIGTLSTIPTGSGDVFFGIVSDTPFDTIAFDEADDGDDIAVREFILAEAIAPTARIVQGATDDFLAFEAEDYDPNSRTFGDAYAKIDASSAITELSGAVVSPTGITGGAAILDPAPTIGGGQVNYTIEFAAAGTYYLYLRGGMYNIRDTAGHLIHEDSFKRSPGFGEPPTVVEDGFWNTGDFGGGGNYAWWNKDVTYTVEPGDVGQPLAFSLAGNEAGMSFDAVVFSQQQGLDDAALDALMAATPRIYADAPTITPDAKLFGTSTTATMATLTPGAEIRYTTDGSDPTAASTLYTAPLAISATTTLRARAFKAGLEPSETTGAHYVQDAASLNALAAVPGLKTWLRADGGMVGGDLGVGEWLDLTGNGNGAFQLNKAKQPAPGETLNGQPTLLFDGQDDGLAMRWTVRHARPETMFLVYNQHSGRNSRERIIQSATPISFIFGSYSGGSDGLYTGDGWVSQEDIPKDVFHLIEARLDTGSSRFYRNGDDRTFNSSPTGMLNRMAIGGGEGSLFEPTRGQVAELLVFDRALTEAERREVESYLANRYALLAPQVATPSVTPPSGFYESPQTVPIECDNLAAEIRYTTDGSEPTAASALYTAPFQIGASAVVRARAFRAGWGDSAVAAADYEIGIDTAPISRDGLQLWLRADRALTVDGDGGVSRWGDLSGAGNDFTMRTGSQEPVAALSGGVETLVFDGANDGLNSPESMSLGRPSTIFMVARQISGGGAQRALQSTTNNWLLGPHTSTGGLYANGWVRNDGFPVGETFVATALSLPGETRYYFQGEDYTVDSAPSGIIGRPALGGGVGAYFDPFNGEIYEVIMYDRALDEAERRAVEAYLGGRYSAFAPVADLPDVDPPSGYYNGAQSVAISCTTAGAEIRYTLDGSVPDQSDALYTGPVAVAASATLRARAFAPGLGGSDIREAFYGIGAPPIPDAGMWMWLRGDSALTRDGSGAVRIWGDLSGAGRDVFQMNPDQFPGTDTFGGQPAIRFDGANDALWGPETDQILRPSTVIAIFEQETGGGGNQRLIQGNASNWLIGPHTGGSGGLYADGWVRETPPIPPETPAFAVALQDEFGTRFLFNGEDRTDNPTPRGSIGRIVFGGGNGSYFHPFKGKLAEAIIYDRLLDDAEIGAIGDYVAARYGSEIAPKLAAPKATPDGGFYATGQSVALGADPAGADIRYTLDGSEPDESSALYSGPIAVTATATLKARAFKAGWEASATHEATFTIDPLAPAIPHRGDMLFWFRGDLGAADEGSGVAAWLDQSGSGTNAYAPSEANQPALLPASDINGLPALQFDGTSDYFRLPPGFGDFTGGLTAIIVVRHTNAGNWQRYFDLGNGANSQNIFWTRSGTSSGIHYSQIGGNNGTADNQIDLDTNAIFAIVHDPNGGSPEARWFKNSVHQRTQTGFGFGPVATRYNNFIGDSNWGNDAFFQGQIAELMLFKTALDDNDREIIESVIRDRYNIQMQTVALPTFTPNGGELVAPANVEIATATPGAEIRYTLDGSDPDESSTLYTGPVALSASALIRARGFAVGFNPSLLAEKAFSVGDGPGGGDGLAAEFFDTENLTGTSVRRIDPQIAFNFGNGSPDPRIGGETFSGAWDGEFQPRYDEDYTFYTDHNAGARVYLDLDQSGDFDLPGELIIDDWPNDGNRAAASAPAALQKGQRYKIRVEHAERAGIASITLSYSTFTLTKQPIPASQLFSLLPHPAMAATPLATPGGASYPGSAVVALSCATPGAAIRYTLDGSAPDESDALYSSPITVNADAQLRARAFAAGLNASGTLFEDYVIDNTGPAITGFAFAGQPISNGATIASDGVVSVAAADPSGVSRVAFFYQPSGGAEVPLGEDADGSNGYSAAWIASGVPDGNYTLIARAFDGFNTMSEAARRHPNALAPPPAPTLTAPEDGATTNDPIAAVRGTAPANTTVTIFQNGTPVGGTVLPDQSGAFAITLPLEEGTERIHRRRDQPRVRSGVQRPHDHARHDGARPAAQPAGAPR